MSILKIKDSQGNWIGVPTVKGDTGNGISSTSLNDDYTLTLSFTDGTTYTTPSIRGEKGEQGDPATSMEIHICSANEYDAETRIPTIVNPNDKTFYLVSSSNNTSSDLFIEWIYVNNAWEMFGSASIDLTDYIKNTDIANSDKAGVVKINPNYGVGMFNDTLIINGAMSDDIKSANNSTKAISTYKQHESTFYGLAKASGDTTQSKSDNPVGTYTDEAKASIKNMLGVEDVDLHYLTPEMYGAVGDGSTDDSIAIQNCINDAITKELPVRGFNIYATTQPINIVAKYLNLYIHEIIYSGDNVAVILTGRYNIINIDEIDAYDSTGCGFRLATTEEREAIYNEIHIGYIASYGNGIEYLNLYGESQGLYYNKLYVNQLYSRNANCIYINATNRQCGENSFWGKHVTNNNGYFLYCVDSGNNISNKFYEFCIESSSKNGVYGQATLINCRTVECMDRKKPNNDEGTIFTFNGVLPIAKAINTPLDYLCVDVTNASTYESRLALIKTRLEEGETKAGAFDAGFPQEMTYIIGEGFRLWDYYAVADSALGNNSPIGKVIAYYNHKGFVPDYDWYHKIEVNDYYTLTTDHKVPTIFDIDVNTTIHLDDSYCPVGIKEFKVIQYDDKKAMIYDHNNHLIFNGQNYNAGTYRIKCRLAEHTFDVIANSETFTYGDIATRGKYFGMNDEWSVEQIIIDEISTLEDGLDSKAPVITETVSGDIVSFDDGADDMPLQSLVVNIEPVQDLHGYDSPWPAGGGKNLADTRNLDVTVAGIHCVSDSDGVISLSGTRDSSTGWKVLTVFTDFAPGNYVFSSNNQHVTCLLNYTQKSSGFTVAEGDIVRIALYNTVAGDTLNDTGIKVQIESGSTATDWTPYENICPITGWTGCEVQRTGKNLLSLDESEMVSNGWNRIFPISLKAGTYIISCQNQFGASAKGAAVALVDDSGATVIKWLSGYEFGDSTFVGRATTITEEEASKIKNLQFSLRASGTTYNDIMQGNIQLELGSTATEYESYTGRSITIDLGQTVYGGYVDVIGGELIVDRAIVDLGTLEWYKSTSPQRFESAVAIDNCKAPSLNTDIADILIECYKTVSANTTSENSAITMNTAGLLRVYDSGKYETMSRGEFKTAMSGVQLLYPLAKPIHYLITFNQINSLFGQNNIWANTGNSEVTYRADTELYIDKQIPEIPVNDVQIDGTSVVADGVGNIPIAGATNAGAVKVDGYGLQMQTNKIISIKPATPVQIKAGVRAWEPIVPGVQHQSVFYGLAKAAGVDEKDSTHPVGTYTDSAKTAIKNMLGVIDGGGTISETITGTDPTITAQNNFRYMCGELYTLNFTPCVSGVCEVIFTSGATPTVLTLPDTVRMPAWWTGVEANTTYEISIVDGVYGAVMSWS